MRRSSILALLILTVPGYAQAPQPAEAGGHLVNVGDHRIYMKCSGPATRPWSLKPVQVPPRPAMSKSRNGYSVSLAFAVMTGLDSAPVTRVQVSRPKMMFFKISTGPSFPPKSLGLTCWSVNRLEVSTYGPFRHAIPPSLKVWFL